MSAHEPDWMQRFDATLLRRMNSPGWRDSLTLYVTDDHGGAWSRNLAREGATTEPALTNTTPKMTPESTHSPIKAVTRPETIRM